MVSSSSSSSLHMPEDAATLGRNVAKADRRQPKAVLLKDPQLLTWETPDALSVCDDACNTTIDFVPCSGFGKSSAASLSGALAVVVRRALPYAHVASVKHYNSTRINNPHTEPQPAMLVPRHMASCVDIVLSIPTLNALAPRQIYAHLGAFDGCPNGPANKRDALEESLNNMLRQCIASQAHPNPDHDAFHFDTHSITSPSPATLVAIPS